MKLLGSTKSKTNKTNKDKNGENMPNLEISKVVFIWVGWGNFTPPLFPNGFPLITHKR